MKTSPLPVLGPWSEGFALDQHTEGSTCLGHDEYGQPVFETRRTELGERPFQLKYRGDRDALSEIVAVAAEFVRARWPDTEVLVAVPASDGTRAVQPVHLIADALAAKLGVTWDRHAVTRGRETPPLKNVFDFARRSAVLEGAHHVRADGVRGKRVLLLDDLIRSGATLGSVARALADLGHPAALRVLAITRTRVLR